MTTHLPPYATFDLTKEPEPRYDKPSLSRPNCWRLSLIAISFGLGLLLGAMLFP